MRPTAGAASRSRADVLDVFVPALIESAAAGAVLTLLAIPLALLLRGRAGFLLWGVVLLPLFVPEALLSEHSNAAIAKCPLLDCARWFTGTRLAAALLSLPFAVIPVYRGFLSSNPLLLEAAVSLGAGALTRFAFRLSAAAGWMMLALLLAAMRYAWSSVDPTAFTPEFQWGITGAGYLLLALLVRPARGRA